MNKKNFMNGNKLITFLIAQRRKNEDFFKVFDSAVVFKEKANVVVLEDANALKLVLENFSTNIEFRLLVHADIGDKNTSDEIKKETVRLKTIVSDIQAIQGCNNINPFFVTRSGNIETSCLKEKKCFVQLKPSGVMCSHTSFWAKSEFLEELKPFAKGLSANKKDKIQIFIGSSTQGLEYANKIKEYFEKNDNYDAHVWTSEFPDNKITLESLEKILQDFQYSIFIFTPDDTIITIDEDGKKTNKKIPRDNVIFEYGLFYGKYSRTKTFLVLPKSHKKIMKTMSDIEGLSPYYYTDSTNILNAVTTACSNIIKEIGTQN